MLTSYWMNAAMDTLYANASGSFYVGLSSTEPNADGTNVTEPTGGNYARKKISLFTRASNGSTSNAAKVIFNESTGVWFTDENKAAYYVIFDGVGSSAHVLSSGEFFVPMAIGANESVEIPAGAIKLSLYDTANS